MNAQVETAVAQRAERGNLQLASVFGHVNTLRALLLGCDPSGAQAMLPHALANTVRGVEGVALGENGCRKSQVMFSALLLVKPFLRSGAVWRSIENLEKGRPRFWGNVRWPRRATIGIAMCTSPSFLLHVQLSICSQLRAPPCVFHAELMSV